MRVGFSPFKPTWLAVYFGALLVWLATTAMHIPDGYLSPATSLVMLLLVLPFWVIGIRKVRETMSARSVPLIALMAAFSFVIMMFNIPLPGGTTGHAIGAALAAVLLGPEVATIAISIALIIQAFFFGDGGILAIGANCFNMAIVGSLTSLERLTLNGCRQLTDAGMARLKPLGKLKGLGLERMRITPEVCSMNSRRNASGFSGLVPPGVTGPTLPGRSVSTGAAGIVANACLRKFSRSAPSGTRLAKS